MLQTLGKDLQSRLETGNLVHGFVLTGAPDTGSMAATEDTGSMNAAR